MKQKLEQLKFIQTIMLLLTCTATAAVKPEPYDPNLVPFKFDANECTSPLWGYHIVEPNYALVTAVGGHNKWGLNLELDVVRCDGEIIDINLQKLAKVKDDAGGWNQYWQWSWTVPAVTADTVFYLEMRLTDKVGRQDRRTLLVYAASDDVPFLFPVQGPIPVARLKQAQQHWQWAKKKAVDLGKAIVR